MSIDPYSTRGRCPICGAIGPCPDGAPVPVTGQPFDLAALDELPGTGALRRYRVTMYGFQTYMQLNDSDAAGYGDAAVLDE